MQQQLEKDIEQSILTWLNFQPGCYAFKMEVKGTLNQKGGFLQPVGKFVAKGGSDIIFCLHSNYDSIGSDQNKPAGFFGSFEVKTPAAYKAFHTRPGKHELEQMAFIQKVRSCGGFAEIVCSLDQVIILFKQFKEKKYIQPKGFPLVLN